MVERRFSLGFRPRNGCRLYWRALDAGCGHGADTLWLAAHGWQVTAVDFSAAALAHGRSMAEAAGADIAERIDWIDGDLVTWTAEPGYYDLVVCLYVHVAGSGEDIVTAAARARREQGFWEGMTMIAQRSTFSVSGAALASMRRLLVAFVLVPLLGFGLYRMIFLRDPGWTVLLIEVVIFLFLAFIVHRVLRTRGETKLHVRPEGVVQEAPGTWREVPWEKITEIRVRQDSRGLPRAVEIFTGDELALVVAGLDPMPEVVRSIQAGLPAAARVEVIEAAGERKRWRAEAGLHAALLIAMTVASVALSRWSGGRATPFDVFMAGTGVYLMAASRWSSGLDREARRSLLVSGLLLLGSDLIYAAITWD